MMLLYLLSILVLVAPIFIFRKRMLSIVAASVFIPLQLVFAYFAWQNKGSVINTYFTIDNLGLLFVLLLTIISIFTIYHSFRHVQKADDNRFSLFFGSMISLTGVLTGAYLANSFTLNWVFIEASTLFAAFLIYHERGMKSLEATWKYVFVCSTGIAFAYMGILFMSATLQATGTEKANFETLTTIVATANPIYLKIAFIFILIGYSTKMELFPMHTVGIDANTVAPATGSAFLSTALVNIGFLSIFRIYGVLAGNAEVHLWMNKVLIITGLGSILVAAGYMMQAKHNKRMLAYSTMENMGIVAIALGTGSLGYYVAILHVIVHTLIKLAFFLQVGQSSRIMGSYLLKECGEYLKKFPLGGITFLLAFLSIVAIPPSGLFLTEIMTIKALIFNDMWWVLVPMLFFLCFVIYGMATRVIYILFAEAPTTKVVEPQSVSKFETGLQLSLLLAAMVLCFYRPDWLNSLINNGILEIIK
jgi:hydrogenase-4 component F